VVVADSSPLIYLSRVGVLDLLSAVFGDLVVPRAVWNEVVERRPSAPGLDALRQASWIRVVDSSLPQIDLGLDPGETAAILLAHEQARLLKTLVSNSTFDRGSPSVAYVKPFDPLRRHERAHGFEPGFCPNRRANSERDASDGLIRNSILRTFFDGASATDSVGNRQGDDRRQVRSM